MTTTTTKSPRVTLRFMAAPTDVLQVGTPGVHGGRVLEWIDKAAYACAVQWSSTYCVTAYVGHIHFTRPIPSGHLVEVRSRIALTGRSSMHIVNEVYSADPREGVFTRACDCLVIFVAKDTATGIEHFGHDQKRYELRNGNGCNKQGAVKLFELDTLAIDKHCQSAQVSTRSSPIH